MILDQISSYLSKYRLVFYAIAVLGVIWFINDWRDMRKENAAKDAYYKTLSQQFEIVNGVAKAQNQLLESNKKSNEVLIAFGQAFSDTMRNQNQVLLALSQSMGRVEGKITTGGVGGVTVQGTVSSATLTQNRDGAPSLTTAHASVDAKDPKAPVWDVKWLNNTETFKINFGMFKKGSTAGELTTYTTLTREVSKADGTLLGKEDIKIGESTMKLDPSFLTTTVGGGGKLDIPRMGVFLGGSWNSRDNRWVPGGGIDYRVSDRMSVMGGYINQGPWVGGKYSFNLK